MQLPSHRDHKETDTLAQAHKMAIDEFAAEIVKMGDEDLFELMTALEDASEADGERTDTDIVARIALVETEIESRFPGQLLAPFKKWQRARQS
jgi:hypothetical protein